MRAARIACETTGCSQAYEHPFGHGPVDQALRREGWMYEGGKWYCPGCRAATEGLRAEQKKGKNKWS